MRQDIAPAATQAEKAVVAAVLGSKGSAFLKLDFLEPKHFHDQNNRQVFEAARAIWEQGGKPDYVTVAEFAGVPRDVVLFYRDFDEGTDNVEEYGRLITAKWLSRELIATAESVANRATSDDPIAVLDDLERKTMQLRPQRGDGFQRIQPLGAVKLSDQPSLIPSGFIGIDSLLDGLKTGRLITLAARPSIGKSTLALNVAANVAQAGFRVAHYSFEMDSEEILEKLILCVSGVDAGAVKRQTLSESDIANIAKALVTIAQWNLELDDTSSLSLFELRTRAKRLQVERGLDLLIVDYLQLVRPPKAESRVMEVSIITRELKTLARELNIPVLALSQLSRQAEMGDGEPQLWHLRDSGTVEQDSDQVIFLWRDPKDARNTPGQPIVFTHAKVAKNRGGPTGYFELALMGPQSRFVEV